MMTKEEAEAFIENPGLPGLYRFQGVKRNVPAGYEVLRRWTGVTWYVGVSSIEYAKENIWIYRAIEVSDPIDNFLQMKISLTEGRLPYRFADLEGNILDQALENGPQQMDFFE